MGLCTHRDTKIGSLECTYVHMYVCTYCLVCMCSAWVLCSVLVHIHTGCVNILDMYSVGSCTSGTG